MNEKIARAARSWNPVFPGRKEVPRHIARTCRAAMALARYNDEEPEECLCKACKINGIDEQEIYKAVCDFESE